MDWIESGDPRSPIYIVGEAPGDEETRQRRPFVGPSGYELDRMLAEAGWPSSTKFFKTNICHVQPPEYRDRHGKLIKNDIEQFFGRTKDGLPLYRNRYPLDPVRRGLERLDAHLQSHSPRLIIALGNTSLWGVSAGGEMGITKWRGSVLAGRSGSKVVPTLHPASILTHSYNFRSIAVQDLRRALRESAFPEIRKPQWKHSVRPSLADIKDFLIPLINSRASLACDIEGWGVVDSIGFASSSVEALCVPFVATDGGCIRSYFDPDTETEVLSLVLRALKECPLTFHNATFDCQVISRRLGLMPRLDDDTMLMQHVLFPGLLGGKIDPTTGRVDKKGSSLSLAFLASMYCENYRYWKDDSKVRDETVDDETDWRYNCLAEDTLVLRADLSWSPIKEIVAGDVLLSFEENAREGYSRKLKLSLVTKTETSIRPMYRITLSDGRYIDATSEHRFLIKSKKGPEWKYVKDIEVNECFYSTGKPWEIPQEYEDAWFAGILDGEGTCGVEYQKKSFYTLRPSFSQKAGPILEAAKKVLRKHGFTYTQTAKANAEYVDVSGGLPEYLRLLGMFPTYRLRSRVIELAGGPGISGISTLPAMPIVDISPLEEGRVCDITTTEGTFIANGFITHNCEDCCRTFEVATVLRSALAGAKLWDNYRRMLRLYAPIFSMMFAGVALDSRRVKDMLVESAATEAAESAWIEEALGFRLNPASHPQMHSLFYDDLACEIVKDRKTKKPTLDDAALNLTARRKPLLLPLIRKIQNIRSMRTNESHFLRPFKEAGDRLRTQFNVTGAETFRFSSSETAFGEGCNMQNMTRPVEDA